MRNPMAVLLIGIVTLICLTGCTADQRQDLSHWKSDLIGLKRKVVLYNSAGTPIKSWEGRFKVEVQGGVARFLDEGKAVMISGTFIIEER